MLTKKQIAALKHLRDEIAAAERSVEAALNYLSDVCHTVGGYDPDCRVCDIYQKLSNASNDNLRGITSDIDWVIGEAKRIEYMRKITARSKP